MPRLRISIVEYLNTAPLVWGMTRGPLRGKYELSFTVPSECAEALRRGEADVALIPAVEYQRIEGLVALPGMAVGARGPVRSILVVARQPIERARRIALDASSRSSAALVRLLCAGHWRIRPEFVTAPPADPATMLAEADAALLIGDPALRLAFVADRQPPALESLYLYDVAEQWRQMTGKPCVLALWAARRQTATPELAADFLASKEYGLARRDEIAEDAAGRLALPAQDLARYLRENIDYTFDPEHQAGLALYYRLCAEAGLTPGARPLEFGPMPTRARTAG